jgi:hypothetical protein
LELNNFNLRRNSRGSPIHRADHSGEDGQGRTEEHVLFIMAA